MSRTCKSRPILREPRHLFRDHFPAVHEFVLLKVLYYSSASRMSSSGSLRHSKTNVQPVIRLIAWQGDHERFPRGKLADGQRHVDLSLELKRQSKVYCKGIRAPRERAGHFIQEGKYSAVCGEADQKGILAEMVLDRLLFPVSFLGLANP